MKSTLRVLLAIIVVFLSINTLNAQAPDTLWTKRYNGPADGEDYGVGCVADDSGYVYISGASFNGTDFDILCFKCDAATGDTVRSFVYDSPYNNNDAGGGVSIDVANYDLYIGSGSSNGTDYDFLIIKLDISTWDTVWTSRYDSPFNLDDHPYHCDLDGSGNLYATGYSNNGNNNDFLTIKFNTVTGETLWTRRHNGSANGRDEAYGVAVDGSGNPYVTGRSYNGSDYDFLTIKYGSVGDTIWVRNIDSEVVESAMYTVYDACDVDNSDNLYVTGICDRDQSTTWGDIFVIKYTSAGDTVWTRRYGGSEYNGSHGCYADNSGNLFVTGTYGTVGNDNYLTIKYDAVTGDTSWSVRYDGPANGPDRAIGCFADGSGYLYINGYSWNGSNMDFLSIKYNTGTGVEEEPSVKPVEKHETIGATVFSGPLLLPADKNCGVFDITGRQVNAARLAPGIYFVEIDGEITQKVIKIKQ